MQNSDLSDTGRARYPAGEMALCSCWRLPEPMRGSYLPWDDMKGQEATSRKKTRKYVCCRMTGKVKEVSTTVSGSESTEDTARQMAIQGTYVRNDEQPGTAG